MEKELIELYEVVKKAADAAAGGLDSSPEEERCLDAMNQLEKFPVNYQLLVSTQVGKRLRSMQKHPRKKIKDLATQLIETWKGIIVEETNKSKNSNSNSDSSNSIKRERSSSDSADVKKIQRINSVKVERKIETTKLEKHEGTITSPKSEKSIKSESLSTEKRVITETLKVKQTVKEEKPVPESSPAPPKLGSIIYCKDAIRDKIRELLAEALQKVNSEIEEDLKSKASSCDPCRVAVSLESAMFEKWGRSNGPHKFKYRSIMFNIKDTQNPDFRRKVLLGHVKPEDVVDMSPEEMASNERQMQNGKIKEKAMFECERAAAPKASTDQFKCGRCGKRQCTYYQLQTRSADEPMTTFVTCVNCNNHWKFC
jgi:transcription elongation factor S-II